MDRAGLNQSDNILLVTGSRALVKRMYGEHKTSDIVQWAIREYGITKLVAGDAEGPDRWAITCAMWLEIKYEIWSLKGFVSNGCKPDRDWIDRKTFYATSPKRLPLLRNDAMVDSVALRDPKALALGFVDPASKTHGTDYTLRLARESGLRTERMVYGD